jgi:hypothetical protein
VTPAVEPAHQALAEGDLMLRLGRALGLAGFEGGWDAGSVSRSIGAVVPAFAGVDIDSVGAEGLPLRGAGS